MKSKVESTNRSGLLRSINCLGPGGWDRCWSVKADFCSSRFIKAASWINALVCSGSKRRTARSSSCSNFSGVENGLFFVKEFRKV